MTARIASSVTLIAVASVADWALTVDAIAAGWAREGNPLMAPLLEQAPAVSLAVKLAITGVCCLGLVLLRDRAPVRVAAYFLAGAYAALLVYHLLPRLGLL